MEVPLLSERNFKVLPLMHTNKVPPLKSWCGEASAQPSTLMLQTGISNLMKNFVEVHEDCSNRLALEKSLDQYV